MAELIPVDDVTKDVEAAQAQSVQSRAQLPDTATAGVGLLHWLARSGETISPWWSKRRDTDLRAFWKKSDHMGSAFYMMMAKLTSVPMWVEPRDPGVKAHRKQAEQFTRMLYEESEFGKGWIIEFGLFLLDLWAQDNGAFFEIIGAGPKDGPIVGPALGIAHLDSWLCNRTSDPDFPVIYDDPNHGMFKLHRTRVAEFSQMRSPAQDMRGVGMCWMSRAVNTAQTLVDQLVYKQEKMGSRPRRAMIWANKVQTGLISQAMAMADQGMDARGLRRHSLIPVIDNLPADASIELMDLASLPDGFDEQTSTTLGMFLIALAGGVPPRWLWPASVTGATKADAMFSHLAGVGGMAGQTLAQMQLMLGGNPRGDRHVAGKFLPPHLKLVFDFQDDEQDRQAAEIAETRSQTRRVNLETAVTDVRTERQNMVSDGELTEPQFRALELKDGRLPDGVPVLALFATATDELAALLDLGVQTDVLDTALHDRSEILTAITRQEAEAMATVTTGNTTTARNAGELALAALAALRLRYEEEGSDGQAPPQETGVDEEQEAATEETEEEVMDEEEEKALASFPDWLKDIPFRAIETVMPDRLMFKASNGKLSASEMVTWEKKLAFLKGLYIIDE